MMIIVYVFFANLNYGDSLRACLIPANIHNGISSLTVFILTFFIQCVLGKYNQRFENVCKTNGYVTRLSALAGALYPPLEAEALMRYTNSLMHVYYFLLSGPMNDEKWGKLVSRGMLTEEEVAALQLQGSPGVVLYAWCVDILKVGAYKVYSPPPPSSSSSPPPPPQQQQQQQAELEGALSGVNMWGTAQLPFQLSIDACIGGTRGLASKQIDYTLQQVRARLAL